MMKQLVKRALERAGLYVRIRHAGAVSSIDLKHDLAVAVGTVSPCCFDVGANQGQTIELLNEAFNEPLIYAFEPSTATYAVLSERSYGPNVKLHKLALGDSTKVAQFLNYEKSYLSSFLEINRDEGECAFASEAYAAAEDVAIETLDRFCAAQGLKKIDLLKIDTQGFDLQVLRGGAEMFALDAIEAVLVELNFAKLYEGQSDPAEVIVFLRQRGLELVDFYEKVRRPTGELSWVTALFRRRR